MKKVLLVVVVCTLAGAAPSAATRSSSIRYSTPAWSPDGQTIVFSGNGLGDLFVMNADGSGIRKLTNSCSWSAGPSGSCTTYNARSPTWSPDSQKIAFTYGPEGICVINADGSDLHRISDTGDDPAWSSGGKKIAYDQPEGARIHVMNPDGSRVELVADGGDRRAFVRPVWSPDGQLLAFGTGYLSDSGYSLPGYLGVISKYRGRVRVFLRGYNPYPASWNGTKIALEYGPSVGIFDMRTNTLKERLHRGDRPSFSPDGRHLVFQYEGNIWVMNADGSGARRLTH